MADFNGDGKLDLAQVNALSDNISVLLGDGNGGFGPQATYAVQDNPVDVIAGDFNEDGRVDLAVTNQRSASISVLLNTTGPGVVPATFTLAENSPAGTAVGTLSASGQAPLTFAITAGNSDPDGDSHRLRHQPHHRSHHRQRQRRPRLRNHPSIHPPSQGNRDRRTVRYRTRHRHPHQRGRTRSTNLQKHQDATFTLPENSPNSTAVGTVLATDIDAGDTLTYAITAGNSDPDGDSNAGLRHRQCHRRKSPSTTAATWTSRPRPAFNLAVTATDAGGLSDTAAVTVPLTDIFESGINHAPRILGDEVNNLVLWNKLGSVPEVQNSEVGEDGTLVGSDYAFEATQHGTGYVRKAVGQYVSFPASTLQELTDSGTIELWINPKVPQPVPYSYGVFGLVGAPYGHYGVPGGSNISLIWGDTVTGRGISGGISLGGQDASTSKMHTICCTSWHPFSRCNELGY